MPRGLECANLRQYHCGPTGGRTEDGKQAAWSQAMMAFTRWSRDRTQTPHRGRRGLQGSPSYAPARLSLPNSFANPTAGGRRIRGGMPFRLVALRFIHAVVALKRTGTFPAAIARTGRGGDIRVYDRRKYIEFPFIGASWRACQAIRKQALLIPFDNSHQKPPATASWPGPAWSACECAEICWLRRRSGHNPRRLFHCPQNHRGDVRRPRKFSTGGVRWRIMNGVIGPPAPRRCTPPLPMIRKKASDLCGGCKLASG